MEKQFQFNFLQRIRIIITFFRHKNKDINDIDFIENMRTLLTIWIKPVRTFKFLENLDKKSKSNLINILFLLSAMTGGLLSADDYILYFGLNPYVTIILAMLFSCGLGLIFYHFVMSPILYYSSRIFQGKGSIEEIKLTIAYSQVPNLILLLVGLFYVILSLFIRDAKMVIFENIITSYVLQLFSISILIYGLSYFNKYSYVYAILTFMIPFALFHLGLYMLKYAIS